jgi:hypothetical protein
MLGVGFNAFVEQIDKCTVPIDACVGPAVASLIDPVKRLAAIPGLIAAQLHPATDTDTSTSTSSSDTGSGSGSGSDMSGAYSTQSTVTVQLEKRLHVQLTLPRSDFTTATSLMFAEPLLYPVSDRAQQLQQQQHQQQQQDGHAPEAGKCAAQPYRTVKVAPLAGGWKVATSPKQDLEGMVPPVSDISLRSRIPLNRTRLMAATC